MEIPPPHPDPPDNSFAPDEQLFHRVREDNILKNRVMPDAIRLTNISCNREKYRPMPECVLVGKWPEYKYVAAIKSGAMPAPCIDGANVPWKFSVEHVPLEENFSHSEVRVGPDGKPYNPKKKAPGSISLELRDVLAEKMYLVSKPVVPTSGCK